MTEVFMKSKIKAAVAALAISLGLVVSFPTAAHAAPRGSTVRSLEIDRSRCMFCVFTTYTYWANRTDTAELASGAGVLGWVKNATWAGRAVGLFAGIALARHECVWIKVTWAGPFPIVHGLGYHNGSRCY